MLIPFSNCCSSMLHYGKIPRGILHIGAHECEELEAYENEGIERSKVYWVDAIQEKVDQMVFKGIPNVVCAALDSEEKEVEFHITNNGQSSSLLALGTHKSHYPHIYITENRKVMTQTGRSYVEKNKVPIQECNFWNLDIQGKELDVLKSMGEYINYADAIYTEVNTAQVYEGCSELREVDIFLQEHGLTRVQISMTGANWGDALYIREH